MWHNISLDYPYAIRLKTLGLVDSGENNPTILTVFEYGFYVVKQSFDADCIPR
jgi:hypothetical protein